MLLDVLGIAQDVLRGIALCLGIEDITVTTAGVELSLTIIIVLASWYEGVTEVELIAEARQWLPDVTEVELGVCVEVDVPLTALVILADILHGVEEQRL